MLAIVNFSNPVLIAVMIGWILSVTLHEFAHGIVAYWAGDYTIKERGGLTLNPFQYIDPVLSIGIPLLVFILGGVPLVGGVTYVRTDLLRSKYWASAVSLAGPAMNFLLFFLLVLPFHPTIGWVHPAPDLNDWTTPQRFLATMAILQFYGAAINLIPVPGIDGFQAIAPFLDYRTREKLMTPQMRQAGLFILFMLIGFVRPISQGIYSASDHVLLTIGFSDRFIDTMAGAYNQALFNR